MTPKKRAIVDALKQAPGTPDDLAARSNTPIRTVRFYMQQLTTRGEVKPTIDFRKDGRTRIYSLTEIGHARYPTAGTS